jgi:polyphosphate glucokinase
MLAQPVRVPTPYPMSPHRFVETLLTLAANFPDPQRVTVGIPGMIRHGVVVSTPHYVTRSGPRSTVDPVLVGAWASFDARRALTEAFGVPTLVLNDAEVHAAGVVAGTGLELVLTLGTGLGCALFDGGTLAPHLELSRAPVRWGLSYDTYIGEPERRRLGDAFWSRRVRTVVEALRPVFVWDRLYLGGGNSRHIRPRQLTRMGEDVVVVPNSAGIVGGVRAWTLGGA